MAVICLVQPPKLSLLIFAHTPGACASLRRRGAATLVVPGVKYVRSGESLVQRLRLYEEVLDITAASFRRDAIPDMPWQKQFAQGCLTAAGHPTRSGSPAQDSQRCPCPKRGPRGQPHRVTDLHAAHAALTPDRHHDLCGAFGRDDLSRLLIKHGAGRTGLGKTYMPSRSAPAPLP